MSGDNNTSLNKEYLKNVILQYFHHLARGEYTEVEILEPVIFNILKVTLEEKEKLDFDRDNYTFWGKTKYVLTAGYFYEEPKKKTKF